MHFCQDEAQQIAFLLSGSGFVAVWVRTKWHIMVHFVRHLRQKLGA